MVVRPHPLPVWARAGLIGVVGLLLVLSAASDLAWAPLVAHHPLVLAWVAARLGHLVLASAKLRFWPFAVAVGCRTAVGGVAGFVLGRVEGEARMLRLLSVSGVSRRPERLLRWLRRLGPAAVLGWPVVTVCLLAGASGLPLTTFLVSLAVAIVARVALARLVTDAFGHQLVSLVDAVGRWEWALVLAGLLVLAWHLRRMRAMRRVEMAAEGVADA